MRDRQQHDEDVAAALASLPAEGAASVRSRLKQSRRPHTDPRAVLDALRASA